MADYAQTFMANEKQLYPNVDFFIGPLYYLLGIPIELDTAIFAASRIAGWAAHVIEQQNDNRIYRPRAIYSGPREQQYIPMQQRAGQTT
jgi:citrate synthase